MVYLFWAHVIVWVVLFIYVFVLVTKTRNLKRELEAFKSSSEREDQEKLIWQKQGVK